MPPVRNVLYPLAAIIIAGITAVTLMVLFKADPGLVLTVATIMLITVPTSLLAAGQGQTQGKMDAQLAQTNGHQSELVALVRDLSARLDDTGRLLASMHPPTVHQAAPVVQPNTTSSTDNAPTAPTV